VSNLKFSAVSADNLSAFEAKSFDAVTMNYVLMYVPDKLKALREIGRVTVEAYASVAGEKPSDSAVFFGVIFLLCEISRFLTTEVARDVEKKVETLSDTLGTDGNHMALARISR